MQSKPPMKRSLLGTLVYVLVVCVAYGIARAIGSLTGWTEPWALVVLSLVSFIGLIVVLAFVYDKLRSDQR